MEVRVQVEVDACVLCKDDNGLLQNRAPTFGCRCTGCVFHEPCWDIFLRHASTPITCPICRSQEIVPVEHEVLPEVHRGAPTRFPCEIDRVWLMMARHQEPDSLEKRVVGTASVVLTAVPLILIGSSLNLVEESWFTGTLSVMALVFLTADFFKDLMCVVTTVTIVTILCT